MKDNFIFSNGANSQTILYDIGANKSIPLFKLYFLHEYRNTFNKDYVSVMERILKRNYE